MKLQLLILPLILVAAIAKAEDNQPNCAAMEKGLDEKQKQSLQAKLIADTYLINTFDKTPVKRYEINLEYNGQTLPLKVNRYTSTIKPSRGTVVFLCGGPAACMQYRPPNVPKDYDVVVSDYIGLGENRLGPATPALMSIDAQATATKKIVQALKLKPYVIYGGSAGTASATEAAAAIEKDPKVTPPQAVILEGVLGSRETQYQDGYISSTKKVMEQLTLDERTQFRRTYAEAMKNLPPFMHNEVNTQLLQASTNGPKMGAAYIRSYLKNGGLSPNGLYTNGDKEDENAFVKSPPAVTPQLAYKNSPYVGDMGPMYPYKLRPRTTESVTLDGREYRAYACEYNSPRKGPPQKYFDGLVSDPYYFGSQACGCRTVAKDYDSKDYQIKAPILYINGEADGPTPVEGARYHFNNQRATKSKVFIEVKDAGHSPSFMELANCQPLIFGSAMAGKIEGLDKSKAIASGCTDGSAEMAKSGSVSK